jgi:hypothetical protein
MHRLWLWTTTTGLLVSLRDIISSKNLLYEVNLKTRQNVADLGTDGNVISKWTFEEYFHVVFCITVITCKLVPMLNQLSTTPWRRMGSGLIDPHFLDLGTSCRWVVSFTPRPLYPQEKSPRYLLDRRLRGPQSRSGQRGENKILDPTGTRTPTPPLSSQSLYRLHYPVPLYCTENVP